MALFAKKARGTVETVRVTIVKLSDKLKEIVVPVGTTIEACFKQAGIEVASQFELRKVINLGAKPKTYKAKFTDAIKEPTNVFYSPNVKGGR